MRNLISILLTLITFASFAQDTIVVFSIEGDQPGIAPSFTPDTINFNFYQSSVATTAVAAGTRPAWNNIQLTTINVPFGGTIYKSDGVTNSGISIRPTTDVAVGNSVPATNIFYFSPDTVGRGYLFVSNKDTFGLKLTGVSSGTYTVKMSATYQYGVNIPDYITNYRVRTGTMVTATQKLDVRNNYDSLIQFNNVIITGDSMVVTVERFTSGVGNCFIGSMQLIKTSNATAAILPFNQPVYALRGDWKEPVSGEILIDYLTRNKYQAIKPTTI